MRSSSSGRGRRWLGGALRVGALLAACSGVLLWADYRAARAAVFERLLGLGTRMAPYLDDRSATEAPREVHVNGARFFVAAGHTDHPPEMVRKFYRDRYAGKDGGLGDFEAELRRKHAIPTATPDLGPVEFGDRDRGGVAALDWGDGKSGIRELAARMRRVVDSGDLGDLARLRYCYTERNAGGGTRFLTVWTDDRFNLYQLIAKDKGGDAPGFDLDSVPRLPGTVRAVSTEEVGMPQRMVVYEGGGSPGMAEMFYRARMVSLGWSEEPTYAQIARNQGALGLHFVKQGREAFVNLSERQAGAGGVSVVIVQTH